MASRFGATFKFPYTANHAGSGMNMWWIQPSGIFPRLKYVKWKLLPQYENILPLGIQGMGKVNFPQRKEFRGRVESDVGFNKLFVKVIALYLFYYSP